MDLTKFGYGIATNGGNSFPNLPVTLLNATFNDMSPLTIGHYTNVEIPNSELHLVCTLLTLQMRGAAQLNLKQTDDWLLSFHLELTKKNSLIC